LLVLVLTDNPVFQQLAVPSRLGTGKLLLGDIPRQGCLCLSQDSRKGTAVDGEEQLTPSDILSFPEMDLFKNPVDLGLDGDR